jgi:hypothetical protein
MAGITLADAETALAAALAAHTKALNSHSYSHGGSQVTFDMRRQKLSDLQASIDYWDDKVKRLSDVGSGIILEQYSPDHTT